MGRRDRIAETSNWTRRDPSTEGTPRKITAGTVLAESTREGISVRRGHSTRIKIPSGMRQGFGNKKGKGEWTYIFHRKKWNEEQEVGKSDVKEGPG